MKFLYLLILDMAFISLFLYFARTKVPPDSKKKPDISPLLIGVLLFIFLTSDSAYHPAHYVPVWFEDFLLNDLLLIAVAVFITFTRKLILKQLIITILLVSTASILLLSATEYLLLKTTNSSNIHNRYVITRKMNMTKNIIIYMKTPTPEEQSLLSTEKKIIDWIPFNDLKMTPAPDKTEPEKRIMWLGDSMTAAAGVDMEKRFTNLLERDSTIPHYNLAVSDTSVDFGTFVLEKYFDVFKPDLIMYGFNPSSGYTDFGKPLPACDFKPLYTSKNNEYLFNCSERPMLVFSDLFLSPPAYILQLGASKTLIGNYVMNIRNSAYRLVAEKFYYEKHPVHETSRNNNSPTSNSDAVCDMVERMKDFSASKNTPFAIVIMPYADNADHKLKIDVSQSEKSSLELMKCAKSANIPLLNPQTEFVKTLPATKDNTIFLPGHQLTPQAHKQLSTLIHPFELSLMDN